MKVEDLKTDLEVHKEMVLIGASGTTIILLISLVVRA